MKQLSVVLAVIPFVVVMYFVAAAQVASQEAEGWDGIGYLLMGLFSGPFLLPLSIVSTYLSFRKDKVTGESMGTAYKVTSIFSLICTSLLTAAGVAGWFILGS